MTPLQLQHSTVPQQCPAALLRYRKPFRPLSSSRAQLQKSSPLSRRASCPAVRAASELPAADGSAQHGDQNPQNSKPVPARSLALLATGTSLALASAWMFSQVCPPHTAVSASLPSFVSARSNMLRIYGGSCSV